MGNMIIYIPVARDCPYLDKLVNPHSCSSQNYQNFDGIFHDPSPIHKCTGPH